jgi:signal transduction histidine kinase
MMPRLVILQGPGVGTRYELKPGVTIVGRHSTNAVSIDDPRASRRHCELHTAGEVVTLVDLGSGNGTLLNDRIATRVALKTGDRIQVGDTLLLFATDDTKVLPAPNPHDTGSFVLQTDPTYASAILRSIPAEAGSQMLARPELAGTEYLRQRLANLAVMYEASNAVSDILDLDELLVRIVDLVLKTTEGDHGCAVLLDTETGELTPKAIRSRGKNAEGELNISRTVVDHVLSNKQGVLISDAAVDERFRQGASIAKHQIREVICVPMKGRHDTVGVLFLDTQAPTAKAVAAGRDPVKFTEDHLRLAVAVAHQAALAIEENRHYQGMLQAERLAAIGQTIAALSHHIKNIMQGVRFGSDMVRMGLPSLDAELLAKGWRLVEKNQAKIDDLILDMLSFSKEREPAFEATDLNGLANEVLEVVRGRAAGAGIALEFQALPELGLVQCDVDGIHRALLNIVSNAVDAVESIESPRVVVSVRRAEGFAEIAVSDNGPGIPKGKYEEIFKPFVSTKGGKGTGLGLPVSRKTLREHGGDVIVNSEEGKGTEFVLRLPMS